ncbi:MAG TPA: glycosyltransferase family A protein, partial [Aggregatilineales bacterium]|nr:glycosyltransferase family A protein [Aggregatilineales bacterium]
MPYQFNVSRRHSLQFGAGSTGVAQSATLSEALLNAIPGGLAWLSLVIVLILAWQAPLAMVFGAALLSTYTAIRFVFAGIAVFLGLRRVREWEAIDWQAEYQRRATPASLPLEKVHHLVIIPNYREDLDTLRRSLTRLAEQRVAKTQVTVMLAMESSEEASAEKGEALRLEFENRFANFFVAVHPRGLHLEMQCKSANEAWAARWAKRRLVDEGDGDYELRHIVVTTMDADTLWHPNHLEALGVLFATDESRYGAFWQAP